MKTDLLELYFTFLQKLSINAKPSFGTLYYYFQVWPTTFNAQLVAIMSSLSIVALETALSWFVINAEESKLDLIVLKALLLSFNLQNVLSSKPP